MPYPYWEHTGHADHGWEWLVALLLVALIIGIVTAIVVRWLAARQASALPVAAAGIGPVDDALGIVRMRYARGESDREQYLQATADLGGAQPPPAAAAPPAAAPPPDEQPKQTDTPAG
jgi:uncharacterized membrane protein